MMLAKKDISETVSRMRSGLEIGAVVSGAIFAMGIIFSSGVQYSQLTEVRNVQTMHAASISMLQAQLMPINEALARQDALLSDIRSDLRLQSDHRSHSHARWSGRSGH